MDKTQHRHKNGYFGSGVVKCVILHLFLLLKQTEAGQIGNLAYGII